MDLEHGYQWTTHLSKDDCLSSSNNDKARIFGFVWFWHDQKIKDKACTVYMDTYKYMHIHGYMNLSMYDLQYYELSWSRCNHV